MQTFFFKKKETKHQGIIKKTKVVDNLIKIHGTNFLMSQFKISQSKSLE